MAFAAIRYTAGDRLPVWEETVTFDGAAPDLSSGWSFEVALLRSGQDPVAPAADILGLTEGRVQVQWADGDTDLLEGTWRGRLHCTRDSDGAGFTVWRPIYIKATGS